MPLICKGVPQLMQRIGWIIIVGLTCLLSALGCSDPDAALSADAQLVAPGSSDIDAAPAGLGEKSKPEHEPLPTPGVQMPVGYQVLGENRQLPITMANLKYARLRYASVNWKEVHELERVLGSHYPGNDPLRRLGPGWSTRLTEELLTSSGNQATEVLKFDVFKHVKGELALVIADAPGTHTRVALLMKGSLNVLLKVGDESGLVWVTHHDGSPASRVRVRIMQGATQRFQGNTDISGVLRLPAGDKLRLPQDSSFRDRNEPLYAFADSKQQLGFTSEHWRDGISPWAFDIPSYYWDGNEKLVGTLTAERGIYRPGDTVHLLGMMRERGKRGRLLVPRGKASLTVKGVNGDVLVNEKVQLTRFGSLRHEFQVPKTAGLGRYQVQLSYDNATLHHRFTVGKYRKVRFEAKLGDPGKQPQILGRETKLQLPVEARYLYGAPIRGGKLKYDLSVRPGYWAEQGFTAASDRASGMRALSSQETEIDANGKHSLMLDLDKLLGSTHQSSQKLDLLVEASITDATGDTVTTSRVIPVYRNSVVVGLKSDVWVVDSQKGWTSEVLTLTPDGAPAPAQVELELYRRVWISTVNKNSHGYRHSGRYEERLVQRKTINSHGKPQKVHFDTADSGSYMLRAKLSGQSSFAQARVWAYGNGAYGRYDEHPRVTLHADKDAYAPGETATLLVESPYPKAQALVTLERQGVEKAFVQELVGAGTPIKIQLDSSHLPNVFASVALIPLGKTKLLTSTPLRMAYKELTVSPEQRRLDIQVKPRSTKSKPGKTIPVDVRVRDHQGKPIRAEVTLWAADEGVLKLTGYRTPDVFSPMYPREVLRVFTASSLLRYTQLDYEDDDTGGDSDPGPIDNIALRSRFLDTAFFSKGVVTGADGKATINLPLPDNLTRWRVMAAGADRTNRFGSAESAVSVSKPVQVSPGLPRFLTKGDELQARLVVQNNTQQAGTATVKLSIDNAQLLGADKQQLAVAAGAQAVASFKLKATHTGPVKFQGRVLLGEESDGFELSIPAHAATSKQVERIFDGKLTSNTDFEFDLPKRADPDTARLIVEVAPSGLASLGAAVDSLIDYPHGCLEQTTSRLIPMTLLSKLLSGHPAFAKKGHDARMEAAVLHLLKNQNRDGGFSLWEGGNSEPFLTAYAMWGLSIADQHGYHVPKHVFTRGLNYVQRRAYPSSESESFHGIGEESFIAFALRSLNAPNSGLNQHLLQKQKELPLGSRALLVSALGSSNAGTKLLNDLWASAKPNATGGMLLQPVSNPNSYFSYGEGARASAALVAALVQHKRLDEAGQVVEGILASRNSDGSWGTTFNNQWALFGVSQYYESALSTNQSWAQVWANGEKQATLHLTQNGPFQRTELDAKPGKSRLSLRTNKGADLGAVARLTYYSRPEDHRPTFRGLTVVRSLVDAETNQTITEAKVGQLIRVNLTLISKPSRQQVALIDRVPAGLEPVDTSLATARQLSPEPHDWRWVHRELHDERVAFFANYLSGGTHNVSYLARASRPGQFVHPAPRAEAMYDPDVYGVGAVERFEVKP